MFFDHKLIDEPFPDYMSKTCEVEFHDCPISDFTLDHHCSMGLDW